MKTPHELYLQNKTYNFFASDDFVNRHGFWLVVVLSGISGFILGLAYPIWQVIAESSQILAGLVNYSRENTHYLFNVKAWSVLNQIGAFALMLGVSEKTLSWMMSGCIGMLYFQGISIFVFALGGSLVSILIPFFIYYTHSAEFGVSYPLKLVGIVHTHGAVGQGFIFLALALFCAKKHKIGGFFSGLAPAIHPTLGAFLWMILAIAFLWDFQRLRQPFVMSRKCFALGCLISGISGAVHLLFTYDDLTITADAADKYINAVIRYWDVHRLPVFFNSVGFYLGTLSLFTSLSLLVFCKKKIPEHFLLPLRLFTITGVFGGLGCVLTHLSPELLNKYISGSMPSRLLNINVLGFVPLLVGVMVFHKERFSHQVNLLFLVMALFLALVLRPEWLGEMALVFAITISTITLVACIATSDHMPRFKPDKPLAITMIALILIVEAVGMEAYSSWNENKDYFQDWTNNRLFAEIHHGEGYLLVGPLYDRTAFHLVQVNTRRPVLLGGLETIPYVPELAPEFERILKMVYGVDFFNPSPEARMYKDLPVNDVQTLWESRTPAQWQEIKAKFQATDILTYASWKLQLPIKYSTEEELLLPGYETKKHYYTLYHIP